MGQRGKVQMKRIDMVSRKHEGETLSVKGVTFTEHPSLLSRVHAALVWVPQMWALREGFGNKQLIWEGNPRKQLQGCGRVMLRGEVSNKELDK